MFTTWENIPKSAIDSQTIAEYIDQKISEHEAEPTSHMGTGESIDMHRKNDILDHKVGSVLSDKETMSELKFYSTFETLSSFDVWGDVSNADQWGVSFSVYSGEPQSGIALYSALQQPFIHFEKDFLFQSILHFENINNNTDSYFGLLAGYATYEIGAGFILIDGVIYTHVNTGSGHHRTALTGLNPEYDHIYRVQYISDEHKIYFFVNGVQVDSYTVPVTDEFEEYTCAQFDLMRTGSGTAYLRIASLLISREV